MKSISEYVSHFIFKFRSFLLLFITVLIGFIYYNFSGGIFNAIAASSISIIILWFSRNVWLPREYRTPIITNFTLIGFFTSSLLIISNYDKIKPLLKPLLTILITFTKSHSKQFPFLKDLKLDESLLNSIIIILLLVIFFSVNYIFKSDTIVLRHSDAIKKDFPELDFSKKLIAISQSLENELNKIDKETNWSDYYFTPLEAEVEIYHNNKKERKITDLMQALKKNKLTKVFLLIGDPGSGKSVALRKLCKDIIKETKKTGRIPIYINLKEWEPTRVWTEQLPPTSLDLQEFVLKNLKSKLDVFGNNFFEEYYYKLHSQGRLYYIIDSFDEIPSLLDVTESSWLIKQLSHAVFQFITSGYESRGILSSRLFRKPSKTFDAQVVLEIRSMSNYKIQQNLIKSGAFNYSSIKQLYRQRIDLIHLASNPFLAALISNFVKKNKGEFPKNRTDLFNSYINSRLSESQGKINEKKLTGETVILYATKIAELIFSEQLYGLEIPLETLKIKFKHTPHKIEDIVEILVYSKIGRIGTGEKNMFSFVHRRFNEYFVVQSILKDDNNINLSSIPSDSRYRDALVLYCEVAPDEKAIEIVNFCWAFINQSINEKLQLTDHKHLEAVFCLRFLRDAFIQRIQCIEHIRQDLSNFIFKQMKSENFLVKKIILESCGLLNKIELEKTILTAFNSRNIIIQETAFKEGKFLTEVNKTIEKTLVRYLLSFSFLNFYFEKKEIKFSLGLSPVFKKVSSACDLIIFDQYLLIIGLLLASVNTNPLWFLFSIIYMLIFIIGSKGFDGQMLPKSAESREKANKTKTLIKKFLQRRNFRSRDLEFKLAVDNVLHIQSRFLFACLYIAFSPFKEILHKHHPELSPILFFSHSIIVFMCLFPFIDSYLIIKSIQISKGMVKLFLRIGVPALLVYALITYTIMTVSNTLMRNILIGLSSCGLLYVALLIIITHIKSYKLDKKIINSLSYFENMDRAAIATTFNKINYSSNRTLFVKQLEANVISVSGHWPSNTIPNVDNDYASLQLLELDAIWLGLNS